MKVAKSSLFLVITVLVAAAAFFVYMRMEAAAAVAEKRDQLLADIDGAVLAGDTSADDLGRLRVRLGEFDASDRQIALALARLDVAQGRHGRAVERLQPLMLGAEDAILLRTAALAWLSWPLRGGRDATERRGLWQQAMDFARSAYARSRDPSDLFLAWQAAARTSDGAAMQSIAKELLDGHGQTLQARTVDQATASDLGGQGRVEGVDNLAREWGQPPIELRLAAAQARVVGAMKAEAIEEAQDQLFDAVESLDELVQEASNFIEVRHWAATARHLAGLASAAGAARDGHLRVRDQHLEWLATNAALDDLRRPSWNQMQGIR